MRLSSVLVFGLAVLSLLSCNQSPEVPVVPPLPEDLSTWSVPELVQPPPVVSESPPLTRKPTAAEKVYDYTPGTTYAVSVPLGWPLDVVLEHGESVRNIVGGNRAPTSEGQAPVWEVKEGSEGIGDSLRSHVFVTASAAGITTGVIITTSRRTYYLTCKSVGASPIRVVRWHYPDNAPATPLKEKEPGLLPDPTEPKRYHVGYMIESQGRVPDWMVRQVVDDGRKTYLIYPEVTLFDTVPLVRLLGPNGPQLVNARQVLNVVVLDQLLARAELRIGLGEHAETVTIQRGTLRTITCPGDPACPVWPAAAATLTRRQP